MRKRYKLEIQFFYQKLLFSQIILAMKLRIRVNLVLQLCTEIINQLKSNKNIKCMSLALGS